MRNNFLFIFIIIFLLNGCVLKPKMNLNDHEGEGYFVGIIYADYKCFIPMEFIVSIHEDMSTPWAYDDFVSIFAYKFLFKNNNKAKMKLYSDYNFYFVIVKGEIVRNFYKKKKSSNKTPDNVFLRIDKIIYSKVVDKGFVNCLFDKEISWKRYKNYYLKHPKEILKLCPCKPLKEIKKRKNIAFL